MPSASKTDQLRAFREARLVGKSFGVRVEGHAPAMAESNGSDDSRVARKNATEQSPNSSKHRPTERLSGQSGRVADIKLGTPKAKVGRPRWGETRAKPWLDAKMSRATWYRRKAELKQGREK